MTGVSVLSDLEWAPQSCTPPTEERRACSGRAVRRRRTATVSAALRGGHID
ncbi:hypothetical protein ACFUJR_15940 [Streptomyces sp. NPDC057271]|uniref:hypothetical protein n=1 Tax=unclassified Streptomyces TaxID=2593676 RepID=UPI00363BA787